VDGGPCGEGGIDGRKGVDEGKLMSQSDWQTQKLRKGRGMAEEVKSAATIARDFVFLGTTKGEECCFCLAVN
jgi:hypothetical protein